jgi:hypothetical protein
MAVDENAEFIRALFGGGDPPPAPVEADPDAPPDFDAGVRETAPGPEADPAQAHNELVAGLLNPHDLGGGP